VISVSHFFTGNAWITKASQAVDFHIALIVKSSAGIVEGISGFHHANTNPSLIGSAGAVISVPKSFVIELLVLSTQLNVIVY
jgi:hypothetical protein